MMSPSTHRDHEMDLIQHPGNRQRLPTRNSSQGYTTDSNSISQLHTRQHAIADSSSSSPPEAIEPGEVVSRLRRNRRTQNGDQGPNPQNNSLADAASPGKSNFKQYRDTFLLAALTSFLLGFSTWLIYIEFISLKEVPRHLELPPGKVITLVNVLSRVILFLVAMLVVASWEAMRKSMAAGINGISNTNFLAMSTALTYTQTRQVLRIKGRHKMVIFTRVASGVLCFVLGLVLLFNPEHTTIYNSNTNSTIDVIAGLAPINAYLQGVPASVIDLYYQAFTRGVLKDSTLVAGIAPLTCSGSDCASYFLPGGLDLVRLADGGANSSLYEESQLDNQSTVLINNGSGYHLEYFPVPPDFVFPSADCKIYGGTSNEAIHICLTAQGTQILAGWSICPSDLYYFGLCFNDTSWTDQPDESTALLIHHRYADVAYDLNNFTILSVQSITDPEPIDPAFISQTVGNLSYLFSFAFTTLSNTFKTSDPGFENYTSSWCSAFDIGWALRLYQDDYRNYPGGPLDVLKGFLTVPIQFSTTAWQWASFDTLPQDLLTTASFSTSSQRALGKLWVLIVFTAGAGALVLLSVAALLWVVRGPRIPDSPRWSELDALAMDRVHQALARGELTDSIVISDMEHFSTQTGNVAAALNRPSASFRGGRLFVGAFRPSHHYDVPPPE